MELTARVNVYGEKAGGTAAGGVRLVISGKQVPDGVRFVRALYFSFPGILCFNLRMLASV